MIKEAVLKAEKDKLQGIIIPEISFGEGYWAKCKALEKNCYVGDETIEAARFFNRKLITKIGGYDKKMISGEDWDLMIRAKEQGAKIGRVDSHINHNEGKMSLIGDLKKKLYYSKKSSNYLDKHFTGSSDLCKFIFRPAYFRNWKKINF